MERDAPAVDYSRRSALGDLNHENVSSLSAYFGHLFSFFGPSKITGMSSTLMSPASVTSEAVRGRVRFMQHAGERVLLIDYSHCDAALFKEVAGEGHRVIATQLLNSVLTLSDVTGTSFDSESVALLKSKVAANAPYVKRAAVVGISGLQALIYEGIQAFSKRRIPLFSNRQQALDWLVKD